MEKMKMSNSSWSEPLRQVLANRNAPNNNTQKLALIGIGNELNGDDAAGVEVLRRLRNAIPEKSNLMLIEAGPAPESFTGPLRRFSPDWVVLVDAAQMQEPPGTIAWLEWQDSAGMSASTHTLPPSVLSKFLVHELGCQVGLLLIQVEQTDFDHPISPAVNKAIKTVSQELIQILQDGSFG